MAHTPQVSPGIDDSMNRRGRDAMAAGNAHPGVDREILDRALRHDQHRSGSFGRTRVFVRLRPSVVNDPRQGVHGLQRSFPAGFGMTVARVELERLGEMGARGERVAQLAHRDAEIAPGLRVLGV